MLVIRKDQMQAMRDRFLVNRLMRKFDAVFPNLTEDRRQGLIEGALRSATRFGLSAPGVLDEYVALSLRLERDPAEPPYDAWSLPILEDPFSIPKDKVIDLKQRAAACLASAAKDSKGR